MSHKEKVVDYFYSHLLSSLWSLFLLLGGSVFIGYFAHIEYMPDLDFSSSVAIVGAAAISALMLAFMMLVIFVFPGASWAGLLGDNSKVQALWTDKDGRQKIRRVALWFGAPLITFYASGVAAIFVWWLPFPIVLSVILGSCFLARHWVGKSGRDLAVALFYVWGAGLLSAFFAFFPFWLIYVLGFSSENYNEPDRWFVVIVVGMIVALINLAAVAKPENVKSIIWYSGLGALALFITITRLGQYHVIPSRVIQLYKFGNIQSADIVVSDKSCRALEALDIEPQTSGQVCRLYEVTILSRLGSEFYIEADRHERRSLRVAIPSEDVVAWSITRSDEAKSKEQAEGRSME